MMKLQIGYFSLRSLGLMLPIFLFVLLATTVACTEGLEKDVASQTTEDDLEVIIEIGEDDTRGAYVEGKDLLKYGVYSFYNDTKKLYLSNSILTRDKAGDAWKKSKAIKYPNATRALDFYAMAPEFTGSLVTQSYMKPDEKYIVFSLPTTNALQTDFLFSSLIGATQTNNKVIKFNFKHLFTYLRFNSKLSNEKIDVKVHSITLHNLQSTGKFTMDNNKANTGTWTLDSTAYADYEFVLPVDSSLVYKKTLTLHRTDSLLFVMPQNPTMFNFVEGSSSFATADSLKQAYASVKCRIVNKADSSFVGCTATTWAEVYYPIKTATWITAKQPFGTSKTVTIEFTGGYTYDGDDFLQTNSNDASLENTSVEGVKGGVYSTDWVDDTENSVTITL